MKKTNKKGFTIVELVIVIAVIAILSAILIPTFSNLVTKANKTAALAEAKTAYTLVTAADYGEDGHLDTKENDSAAEHSAVTAAGYEYGSTAANKSYVKTYEVVNGACTEFVFYHNNGFKATLTVATGAWTVEKIA